MFRVVIGIIFLLSGLSKYYYFGDFYLFVEKYFSFLPLKSFFVNLINVGEILVGGCLLTKLWIKEASFWVIILSVIFTFISFYLLFFTDATSCMCFGNNIFSDIKFAIPKNILIIILSIFLLKKVKSEEHLLKNYVLMSIFISILSVSFSFIYENNNSNYLGKSIVQGISVEETKNLLENNQNVLFIDSRTNTKYLDKIKGSIPLPFTESENKAVKILKKYIDENYIIITYCDNRICKLSINHADKLIRLLNYNNIFYLQGGIQEWLNQ